MAVFKDFVITNSGKIKYAEAIAGNALTFTRVKLGDGAPTESEEELTDAVSPVIEGAITEIDTTTTAGVARITISVSNENLTSRLGIKEIGVFCKAPNDTEDVLYCYAHSETDIDVIPSGEYGVVSWKMTIALAISNANSETTATQTFFSAFTPTVTPTVTDGKSYISTITPKDCRYGKINGLVTAFYNISGTLSNMGGENSGLTAISVSLPTLAGINAPVVANMVVTGADGSQIAVDVLAVVDSVGRKIDIQYFGETNGSFTLSMLAQYIAK